MKIRILSILLLATAAADAQSISNGTGFFLDATHIVTCAHCVSESARVVVVRSDNTKSEGTIVFADEELDIAVIKTDQPSPDTLGIGDSESIKLLDDLYVFGFPLASQLGSELSASHGKLNSRRSIAGKQWLQLDATINPGNSGGPVLNSTGQVVGIAVARLDPLKMAKEIGTIPERINFAIPSSVIRMSLARGNLSAPSLEPTAPQRDLTDRATKATVLLISIGKTTETQPTAPEPKQAPQNQAAVADHRLREAAAYYVASGNLPTLDGEMEPYAQHVDYYDQGIKTRNEIRADLAKQRQRWTSRRYVFSRVVRTQYDPAKDVGAVIVHYEYDVSNGTKRKTGDAESLIVYQSVSSDPKVILVKEHKFQ